MFDGADVNPVLSFTRPEYNRLVLTQGEKLSIPGVQTKHSMKLAGNKLKLTFRTGQYLLKPVPTGPFKNLNYIPQNEHLTMQIAGQIYDLPVMENCLVKFSDGEFAYLTKRFDVISPEKNRLQEDLAQAAGRTSETHGRYYNYDLSYEETAELLKLHVGAYLVEIEKFYKLILFNYLFMNGDAHLKNFSLYRNEKYNDYLLVPAYDLLMTRLHIPGDSFMALNLFKKELSSKTSRNLELSDFENFGEIIGINEKRLSRINSSMLSKSKAVEEMVGRSYLSDELKETYYNNFYKRMVAVFSVTN